MKRKYIAIGDIHGKLNHLTELIKHINSDLGKDTVLVFLGDYIDRGENSKKVVDFLKKLRNKNPKNVVLLKGNHEDLAEQSLTNPNDSTAKLDWFMNGGRATVDSFGGEEKCKKELLPFIKSLKVYLETEDYIFCHGGMPYDTDVKMVDPQVLMWNRNFIYRGKKTVVVGHTPQDEVTMIGKTIIVDTGCFSTGKLSAVLLPSQQVKFVNIAIPKVSTSRIFSELDKQDELFDEALDKEFRDFQAIVNS